MTYSPPFVARRLCQSLLALVLAYVVAAGLFAWFHYDKGGTPDAFTVVGDFHRSIGGLFAKRPDQVPEAGAIPPARIAPPPEPPPSASAEPPPSGPDARAVALRNVDNVLLPKAARLLREIGAAHGAELDEKKTTARVALVEARDVLGPILDADRHDTEAQALYQRVMELLIAVDKR